MRAEITRKEQYKSGDDVLYTKEITEFKPTLPEKKWYAMDAKDALGLLVQFLGLATIVLAVISYFDGKNEKAALDAEKQKAEAVRARKEYADSLGSLENKKKVLLKEYADSLQEEKENYRSDEYLQLANLSYLQRFDLFQKQWLNEIRELENQRVEERKKALAQSQLTAYLDVTTALSGAVDDAIYHYRSEIDTRALKGLRFKIALFKDSMTYNEIGNFESILKQVLTFNRVRELVKQILSQGDLVTELHKQQRGMAPFGDMGTYKTDSITLEKLEGILANIGTHSIELKIKIRQIFTQNERDQLAEMFELIDRVSATMFNVNALKRELHSFNQYNRNDSTLQRRVRLSSEALWSGLRDDIFFLGAKYGILFNREVAEVLQTSSFVDEKRKHFVDALNASILRAQQSMNRANLFLRASL